MGRQSVGKHGPKKQDRFPVPISVINELIAFKILHPRSIRGYSTTENGWKVNSVRLLEKYQ